MEILWNISLLKFVQHKVRSHEHASVLNALCFEGISQEVHSHCEVCKSQMYYEFACFKKLSKILSVETLVSSHAQRFRHIGEIFEWKWH